MGTYARFPALASFSARSYGKKGKHQLGQRSVQPRALALLSLHHPFDTWRGRLHRPSAHTPKRVQPFPASANMCVFFLLFCLVFS